MGHAGIARWAAALSVVAWAGNAAAADACAPPSGRAPGADVGTHIAAVACAEHRLWFSPFIDANGRLASMQVAEAEASLLDDRATPTWRRVAEYWKGSGLLERMARSDGAADCAGPLDRHDVVASCRMFLIDTPWSAVFVSYVVARAGLRGFRASPRHIDYVRDAFDDPEGPYRIADPDAETPAPGDLLCFSRTPADALGHAGFLAWLRTSDDGRDMHCDIVVSAGNGRLHLIGGNVLQGVTMRKIPLNRQGRLWGVQRRSVAEPRCHPGNEPACNFNRQDWVALLRLKPARTPQPVRASCCDTCVPPAATRRCGPARGATATAPAPARETR